MWQRNETGSAQNVSAWPNDEDPSRHPFTVGAGEEIDFPELLGGFVLVDGPVQVAEKPKPKDAAVAAKKEEGEPQ